MTNKRCNCGKQIVKQKIKKKKNQKALSNGHEQVVSADNHRAMFTLSDRHLPSVHHSGS